MTAAEANKSDAAAVFADAQAGDAAAMDDVVRRNLPLVKHVVKRFLGRGKEYDDLFQTGCIGLMKAIRKFDPQLGLRFSTYAVPLIMGEIRRLLRDDNAVHISRSIHDLSAKIARFCNAFEIEQGRAAGMEEICDALGVDREAALLSVAAAQPVRSFGERIEQGADFTLEDTLASENHIGMERAILLSEIDAHLNDEERMLLSARYRDRMTQEETGRLIGRTQVQISRMESRLLRRLREELGEK